MNDESNPSMNEQVHAHPPETKPTRSIWVPILGASVLALCIATIYQGVQTGDLRKQLATTQNDNTTLRGQLSDSTSNLSGELKAMKDSLAQELAQTIDQTKTNADRMRAAATRHADQLAGRLAQEQKVQSQELAEQLGKVKESTDQASTRLDSISSEFGSARSDIDSTKNDLVGARSEIADTRSDLQRARGDMGVMSGLIATNSKEIQQLRDLGDRNIYEFNLDKSAGMQKVGDVQLALRKSDPKHNRFTLDLMADDKLVQKRDKNINEPVQFYTSKARQVYEIVVNQVDKDKITGYLATPKVTITRAQ